LDAIDVRIFCEMAFGATSFTGVQHRSISPSEIGKKVGIDEKTVRLRVKKLEEEGFIKYYQATPNPGLFGLGWVGFYRLTAFNLQTKYRLIERIQQVPLLLELIDYFGNATAVAIAGKDVTEVDRVVARLVSEFELAKQEFGQRQIGEAGLNLGNLDWRIIRELRFNARRGTSEIAKTLSVTKRMVEYRLGRLLDSGAITVRAAINPKLQEGLIFYELELSADAKYHSNLSTALSETLGERLWSTLSSKDSLIASVFAFSLGEVEDAAVAAAKLANVRYCLPFLLKETIEPRGPNWIDRLIEAKLDSG
jgi:DNA-binding Lrp family transcriptional regulator